LRQSLLNVDILDLHLSLGGGRLLRGSRLHVPGGRGHGGANGRVSIDAGNLLKVEESIRLEIWLWMSLSTTFPQ